MIDCSGTAVGPDTLACISLQTEYFIGYFVLALLIALLFYKMRQHPMRERFTAITWTAALITGMGAINNMLFPDAFFVVSAILFIGALVMLFVRD